GVGKTTMTIQLALEFAERKLKVLLVDNDPSSNATDVLFGGSLPVEIQNGSSPEGISNTYKLYTESEFAPYPYSEYLPAHGRVIQIDERAYALGRRAPVELGLVGSVRPALQALLELLPQRADGSFLAETNEARVSWNKMLDEKADIGRSADKIHPQAVARLISDHAASDAIVVTDTGEVTLWAANWMRQTGRQRITGSFNNAAVGTGLGIANGAQMLDRNSQVILHVGDGGSPCCSASS
ncbi:MAG: hypothetical protein EOP18_03185, partial [Rhizobiaceae bacterium]